MSEEQRANVYDSINAKDDKISTFSNDLHLLKAEYPIFVTDAGIIISFILEHSSKAQLPIVFTDGGISICVNDEQL